MSIETQNKHISSVVVHCLPEHLTQIIESTSQLENVEVAASDERGKIILVLETDAERDILEIIGNIQAFTGVIAATMVYHEFDC